MKVLSVNTNVLLGTANAFLRLLQGLIKNGRESVVLIGNKLRSVYRTYILNPDYSLKSTLLGLRQYNIIDFQLNIFAFKEDIN